MWAISLLTIVLLFPLLSAAPLDIDGGVKDESDGMHSHDKNVTRGGKFFGHNQFDVGNINVSGSVAGDDVSIGHQVNIDVQGHTHDHHHHEADTVIECKEGLREMFKSIDSNKDGLMDAEELLRVCHQNNIPITKSSAVRILTLPNKTVGFNMAKFCELLKDCQSNNSVGLIHFLLQLFDKGSLPPVPAPVYLGVPDFKKCLGTKSEGSSSVWCFPFEKPAACNPTSWEKLMILQKEPKESLVSCGSLPPVPAPAYLGVPDFKKCLGTKSEGSSSVWCIPFEKPAACNPTSWEKLMILQKEPEESLVSCGSLPPVPAPAYLSVPDFKKCLGTKSESSSVWCFPFEKPAACNPTSWDKLIILQKEQKESLESCERIELPCLFDDNLLASRSIEVNGVLSPVETNVAFKWLHNKVPYHYTNKKTKNEDKKIIRDAMNIIEKRTCFKFVFDETEKDRCLEIFIKDTIDNTCTWNGGNVVPVGNNVKLTLLAHVTKIDGTDCGRTGLIIHELMHALGVGHTQRRNDRDKYIIVNYANMKDGYQSQYYKCEDCELHPEIPYNCGSVMHYGTYDFAKNYNADFQVIVPRDEKTCRLESKAWWMSNMQDGSKIPEKDWELLNIIGKCKGSCEVRVGKSTSNTISATVSEGCKCPIVVNKGNWLGGYTYPDEFKVTQDGSSLQVQRTDTNFGGWGMNLSFKCIRETGNIVKRSVQEVATVRGRIVLPADSDFTFPEDSHVHISCDDNSQLPSTSLGSVEVDVSNKSSQEEIHYELEADLSNSGDISMSATINVGWNRDLNGDEWIRKGDFLNVIRHPLYATEDLSNYQIDIRVAFYNY